jgi:peptide/nickel transport system ATP-binding protein/oligopeptide transport system ATP-binding protein
VTLLEVRDLTKEFPVRRGLLGGSQCSLRAVDGVDLTIETGECIALVGESGSGKTTVARCILRLVEPTAGTIRFQGSDLLALSGANLRRARRDFQMVFQDPSGSLNPRMTVGRLIAEPLEVHDVVPPAERRSRVEELLDLVGLPAAAADRYPHQFSGGQRQRVGIARALATGPELLIADEPVSALDVSVQAQILNLLMRLRRQLGLTLLVIAHDLGVVQRIADRVLVMYLGRIVETARTPDLFAHPQHPYTVSLLSAAPVAAPGRGGSRIVLEGELPSPVDPPTGCTFHPRCPIVEERCKKEAPKPLQIGKAHEAACHSPGTMTAGAA